MAIDVDTGSRAPLEVTLFESDGTKGVKAYLIRVEDQSDLGEVTLSHAGRGAYLATFTQSQPGTVHATFVVYTDPTFAEEDAYYPHASELFLFSPGGHERYENKASTAFNQQTKAQEIIAWGEHNGLVITDTSNCRVSVKDGTGHEIYQATQAAPNSDGVYLFTNATFTGLADKNYYIMITISVGGADRRSFQSFFTVG
jgi:hypothetical protein